LAHDLFLAVRGSELIRSASVQPNELNRNDVPLWSEVVGKLGGPSERNTGEYLKHQGRARRTQAANRSKSERSGKRTAGRTSRRRNSAISCGRTKKGRGRSFYQRDPSLDPQRVWKRKDEQDQKFLEVPVLPIDVQEKIHPQAIVEDLPSRHGEKSAAVSSPRDGQDRRQSDQPLWG
jgi:hypothetical protein